MGMEETLFKMAGIPKEAFQQLMAVKNHLNKLSPDKQQEVVGNFVKELQKAVEEAEGKNAEEKE